jgi:hypothetical protein
VRDQGRCLCHAVTCTRRGSCLSFTSQPPQIFYKL